LFDFINQKNLTEPKPKKPEKTEPNRSKPKIEPKPKNQAKTEPNQKKLSQTGFCPKKPNRT
jgi:hypothetical protein